MIEPEGDELKREVTNIILDILWSDFHTRGPIRHQLESIIRELLVCKFNERRFL